MNTNRLALRGVWLCIGIVLTMVFIFIVDEDILAQNRFSIMTMIAIGALIVFAGAHANNRDKGMFFGHNRLIHLKSIAWPQFHFYGGTKQWYLDYFRVYRSQPETIALVGCRHRNGNLYMVERPGRHHNVHHMLFEQGIGGKDSIAEDGFMTSWGRFVSRTEAVIYAATHRQLIRKTSPTTKLFSEDLWTTPPLFRNPAFLQERFNLDYTRDFVLKTLPALTEMDIDTEMVDDYIGHITLQDNLMQQIRKAIKDKNLEEIERLSNKLYVLAPPIVHYGRRKGDD